MRRSLSLPDSFALALAKRNAWTLLSGDRELRELAEEEEVRCLGVLWLLDRMSEHRVIDLDDLRGIGEDRRSSAMPASEAGDRQAASRLFRLMTVSTGWKLAGGSPARSCGRTRAETATFLGSRAFGGHRFRTGPQKGPDAGIAGAVNDPCRCGRAGHDDIVETFDRNIDTDALSEPNAVDDRLG